MQKRLLKDFNIVEIVKPLKKYYHKVGQRTMKKQHNFAN